MVNEVSDECEIVSVDGLDVRGEVLRVTHDVGQAVDCEHNGRTPGL